jgi:hypothetical protein
LGVWAYTLLTGRGIHHEQPAGDGQLLGTFTIGRIIARLFAKRQAWARWCGQLLGAAGALLGGTDGGDLAAWR